MRVGFKRFARDFFVRDPYVKNLIRMRVAAGGFVYSFSTGRRLSARALSSADRRMREYEDSGYHCVMDLGMVGRVTGYIRAFLGNMIGFVIRNASRVDRFAYLNRVKNSLRAGDGKVGLEPPYHRLSVHFRAANYVALNGNEGS